MPDEPTTQQSIDPEFVQLACRLANCQPEQLLAVAWRQDELVVVVAPGPKYVFSAQQIFEAGWKDGQLLRAQLAPADDSPRSQHGDAPPKRRKA